MRLAGTASQYSKNAMPQLISTTTQSVAPGNLRCPYQAKVMKTFEATSSRTGATNAKSEGTATGICTLGQETPGIGAAGFKALIWVECKGIFVGGCWRQRLWMHRYPLTPNPAPTR